MSNIYEISYIQLNFPVVKKRLNVGAYEKLLYLSLAVRKQLKSMQSAYCSYFYIRNIHNFV